MLYENGDQEKEILDTCSQELSQAKERILYITAELDNYRKRVEKERAAWIETAQNTVLLDFLTIVDDIERAFTQVSPQVEQSAGQWLQGFELIRKACYKLLQKYGIEEIPATKTFNPEQHEAIMQVSSPDHASGEIVAVLQKGYMRKGVILRPAQVSVAA
jgi:molecular chaperone GrpE